MLNTKKTNSKTKLGRIKKTNKHENLAGKKQTNKEGRQEEYKQSQTGYKTNKARQELKQINKAKH